MPCDPIICPPRLPVERVVRVTIEDRTLVFDQNCSQILMLLTDDPGLVDINVPASGAYLDTTNRARVIGSLNEAALHWDSASETYSAIAAFYTQEQRAPIMKVGFIDADNGEVPLDAVDAIFQCDECWYVLTHVQVRHDASSNYVDNALLDPVAEWAEANRRLFLTDSRDALTENPTDGTNITARLGNLGYRRTATFYHEGWCEVVVDNTGAEVGTITRYPYLSVMAGALIAGTDLNDPLQAYTLKFKNFVGVQPSYKTSDVVTAVTGFLPGIGLNKDAGHFANMYVNIGNYNLLVEGTTVSGNFIDIVHALDWMAFEAQQRIYTKLRQSRKIPYTERGLALIDSEILDLAAQSVAAGIISDDEVPGLSTINQTTGELLQGAFRYRRESVNGQPEARRSQRLAPPMELCFRVAGAVHYADLTLCATA